LHNEKPFVYIYSIKRPTQHIQQFEVYNFGPPPGQHQIITLYGTHQKTTQLSKTCEGVPIRLT